MNATLIEASGRLRLDGAATIERATQIRAAMLEAIEKVGTLRLDLSELKSIDLTFIQLVVAASRKAAVSICEPRPACLARYLEAIGLTGFDKILREEVTHP